MVQAKASTTLRTFENQKLMSKRQNLSLQSRARAQPGGKRGKQKPAGAQHRMEKLRDPLLIRSMLSTRAGFPIGTMVALEGANIGFQLGGQATDFVLLVVNTKGIDSILKSKVKLGADIAAAAGPKGRDAQAATDVLMRAEILTYSRSRGLFAGISLDGSTLRPDNSASEKIYGRKITAREIVLEHAVGTPAAGQLMVSTLQKASPTNLSDPKSL